MAGTERVDKRKTRRFVMRQAVAQVRTCFLFLKSGPIQCAVLDLSKHGARILSSKKLKAGQNLEVSIYPGRGSGEISVQGEVAWCQTGKQAKFQAGLRFTDFSAGAYERLRKLENENADNNGEE